MSYFTGFLIIIVVLWIYYLQYHCITCVYKVFNDDLIESKVLKTGDMIVFKAYNNFNSIFHGSYFGHIGIVYVDPNDPTCMPYLFEANGIETVPLKDHHSKNGVFLTPLADRMKKYKGRCFVKQLDKPLHLDVIKDFKQFIDYCLNNMYYNYSVISSGIKKGLGIEKCGEGTNCGEIVFLSLIKLGLLPEDYYDISTFHHLKWMASISDLADNYYHDLIEIIDHPFAY